jgi:malate permease and related proteins
MSNLLLLAVCFALGVALRRSGRLPQNAHQAFNGFVINVSLPALILLHARHIRLEPALAYPIAMAWLLFGMGLVFFVLIGRLARLERSTTGGLILSGSLANTSFVGLPMIESFYGAEYVGLGILIDQLGTYAVLCTLGVFVAVFYSAGNTCASAMARKVLSFPPFQALVLAFLLTPFEYPAQIESLLERLGQTLAPLALLSVGYQVRWGALRGKVFPLSVGLGFKLVLAPLLIVFLFASLLGARGPLIQVTVFEAAMAPMIGAAMVAMEHELDPGLVTLMVGIGIPLSFITLPLWWYALQTL